MSKLNSFACLALLGATAGLASAQTTPADPADIGPTLTSAQPQDAAPAAPTDDSTPVKGKAPRGKSAAGRAPSTAASGKDGKVVPEITVNGSRLDDMEERRRSVAGKQIYGREELDRNGDTNLGDVLKRLPGVSIGGRPGRGGDIRMRGLGSGYTQILLNGERPPAGFSLDQLSPDQVERVEIMHGPVAEYSTRAIAGTINIVLRDGYQQKDIQVKLSDSVEQGQNAPNVSVVVPGKSGGLTYILTATVSENRQHDSGVTHNLNTEPDGVAVKDETVDDETHRLSKSLHVTPRLSYKFDGGDQLNFQPFLMASRSNSGVDTALTQGPLVPPELLLPPEYYFADSNAHSSSTFARGFGNWVHKMEGASKLDVKFGLGSGHSSSDSVRYQYDQAGKLSDRLTDDSAIRDRSANTGGKYTTPIGKDHAFAAGWDAEVSHRTETQTSLNLAGQSQFAGSGDDLTAETRRAALFAQDEWDVTPQWSVYLGARWEGIRTTSTLPTGEVDNTSSVFSPLFHTLYKIPGHDKDQVRMSLTRSYKSANVQDLLALTTLSRLNTAAAPDRTGNPYLKPELATGLDAAYEHYLGRAGILSVSGFTRDISDLIRRELSLQQTVTGPRWVSTPSNIGKARTSGVELEAKFQLVELIADAPAIDFRSNYSRYWSNVDGIPGPNNRLDAQPKQSANVGFDYRMKAVPFTLGASFNWTPETLIQSSATQIVDTGRKRQYDAYGLWKFNKNTQLRVSSSNLMARDALGSNLVTAGGLNELATTGFHTYTVWTVKLETKF
ncbi:TonB-dependent receptor [Rugamonas sp.]|uniref:TonB-dependent receptor plug domain-containing protein n=1 Tax=Rugamonas sp. TaxID=1926287 RepID=UPI0025D0D8F2|nr:TonB-dependent receptor [Rugamonas sp.]